MPICTVNRFCFLHCDWLDIIPMFYHVIIQIQDLHSKITRQIYYAVLWPVLNGLSITRSPVEIPFRALLFVGIE